MGLPPGLIHRVRQAFCLDWKGIHGAGHWGRVAFHGRYLARALGVPTLVPQLFALLHDSQRHDDGHDPDHGSRAAGFVRRLQRDGALDLSSDDLGFLMLACEGHSEGRREAPLPIQVCWDADRLDLGRVGIRLDPLRLCTAPARDPHYLEFAWRWSTTRATRSDVRLALRWPDAETSDGAPRIRDDSPTIQDRLWPRGSPG